VQIAVAGVGADRDAARLRKLHGLAHDVGIAGMIAASDVDGGGEFDHGGVIAHFPWPKTFAEIAIEIDGGHVCPLARMDLPFVASVSLAPAHPRTALATSWRRPR